LIYIVDWLSFTTKFFSYEEVIKILKIKDNVNWSLVKGQQGYEYCLYYEFFRINFNEDKKGCFVNMSSKGCRAFESISNLDWYDLFRILRDREDEFNVTRLDVACDDKEGILPIKKIADIATKFIDGNTENVCTKFLWANVTNSTQGLCVYWGSPQSEIRIRFYDKAREQGIDDMHWIRCEMQLRRKNALGMIKSILALNDIGKSYCGVLNNYLRFIKRDDVNISRCSNLKWWNQFVKSANKIRIFERPGIDYNLGRITEYIDNQVGNTLQTFIKCFDGDLSELINIVMKDRKLNKKQLDLIGFYERGEAI